jgi:hypothetical protein
MAGEIEIERPHDVDPVAPDEEAERAADSRVDVEQLVAPVACVVAEAEVEDAAILDGFHQPPRRNVDLLVRGADSERRRARIGRMLAELAARETDETVRALVEVAVEHPDGVGRTRDVLLQHQIRLLGVLHRVVRAEQLLLVTCDHDPVRRHRGRRGPAGGGLQDDREDGALEEAKHIGARLRIRRLGDGDVELLAERVHLLLVAEAARESFGPFREAVGLPQRGGVRVHEDRASVVDRDQERAAADLRADLEQLLDRLLLGPAVERPGEALADVARACGRRLRIAVRPVDGHAEPAEAAGDPESALLDQVTDRLDDHDAYGGIRQRHRRQLLLHRARTSSPRSRTNAASTSSTCSRMKSRSCSWPVSRR